MTRNVLLPSTSNVAIAPNAPCPARAASSRACGSIVGIADAVGDGDATTGLDAFGASATGPPVAGVAGPVQAATAVSRAANSAEIRWRRLIDLTMGGALFGHKGQMSRPARARSGRCPARDRVVASVRSPIGDEPTVARQPLDRAGTLQRVGRTSSEPLRTSGRRDQVGGRERVRETVREHGPSRSPGVSMRHVVDDVEKAAIEPAATYADTGTGSPSGIGPRISSSRISGISIRKFGWSMRAVDVDELVEQVECQATLG